MEWRPACSQAQRASLCLHTSSGSARRARAPRAQARWQGWRAGSGGALRLDGDIQPCDRARARDRRHGARRPLDGPERCTGRLHESEVGDGGDGIGAANACARFQLTTRAARQRPHHRHLARGCRRVRRGPRCRPCSPIRGLSGGAARASTREQRASETAKGTERTATGRGGKHVQGELRRHCGRAGRRVGQGGTQP